MKKILLVGNSPLPDEQAKSRPAAGLRTNQFLKPLIGRFDLYAVHIAMPECYDEKITEGEKTHSDHYHSYMISKDDPGLVGVVQEIHDVFRPDAIVAVNTYPSYIAARLKSKVPMWADLNGWIMAEAQAQAFKMDSNDYLAHYNKMQSAILKRADKFSTVSRAQAFALFGELAGAGRLNKESFLYKFAHRIPNGTEWFKGEENGESFDVLKGVPEDAFVLLWMGGYNTWVDEVTLFKGVARAMEQCEKLYFVSTGGAIPGLDSDTFLKFKEMVEASEYRDRFVFLGWVSSGAIPYIYKHASAGINVDRKCTETLTGARNRINEMMKFGLPVITTLGSEISFEVERAGAGLGVQSGSVAELTEAIAAMYEGWHVGAGRESVEFKKFGENGKRYIEEECNYEYLQKPLIEWLENPRPAPDRNVRLNFGRGGFVRSAWKYLRENGVRKALKKLGKN